MLSSATATLCTCLIAALMPVLASASDPGPKRLADAETVRLLDRVEVLAERRSFPLALRVIRVREDGECNPDRSRCPQQRLYVVASSFDEYPERVAYELPKAFTWLFDAWGRRPSEEAREDFAVIELFRTDIQAPEVARRCRVEVNLFDIKISEGCSEKAR